MGRPVVHDPIGSETLSGANLRIEEFTNGSSVKTPVRLNSSEAINAESYFVPDESLDKEQELVTGISFAISIFVYVWHISLKATDI